MSRWAKVQQLHGEALQQIGLVYGENFPIDVRCALAEWIEMQPWNELDPDNPQHDTCASQLVSGLVQELENKIQAKESSEENFLLCLKLREAARDFRLKYSSNPQQLVRIIKHCLHTEMRIVEHAVNFYQGDANHLQIPSDPVQEINVALEKLRHQTQETADELRQMQQGQEAFVIQYQESLKRQAQIQQQMNANVANVEVISRLRKEKDLIDQALRQKMQHLIHLRMHLVEQHQKNFMELNDLQKRILDTELIQWKRGQQLAGNGVPFENNLDQIQEWCEALADIIWQNRQQIKQVEMLCSQVPLTMSGNAMEKLPLLNQQITGLLSSLVTSTFIIEKQPPQVMKTNTRFTATVRLLVGSKLSVYMTPPQVKVTIISEAQAIALLKNDKVGPGEASGEILNNMGTMEYHQATRQLSVSFRNMQLRKIKRAEKKGTESVMDEKFSLLFQSQFKVGGGELVFQVWTLSLPVVVIVHGNQEPHAWATVTWDNAFAEPVFSQDDQYVVDFFTSWNVQLFFNYLNAHQMAGRVPFQVPEKVSWPEMAEVLSTKFKATTGRELSKDNLQFLAGKAFRTDLTFHHSAPWDCSVHPNAQIPENSMMLSWSQFCKEPLPERSFTFWEWFYAIMKITKEHLRGPWNDGLILGFVGRHQAEEMLLKMCNGTFLLRFSDSELGGVTIAWVTDAQQRDGQDVFMVQPFTSRDFTIRPLADRISDLKNLLYLYPNIPKDQAFGKYYTPYTENQPPSNGYVRPMLVTQIPGLVGSSGLDSYPGTPQSVIHPQSPDMNYHDIHASSDQSMHVGARLADVDYDSINMELMPDMEDPIDFSSIVSDLVDYTPSA